MSDDRGERPSQEVLDDAIKDTINRLMKEWDYSAYDIAGVLTIMAARYAHLSIVHDDE